MVFKYTLYYAGTNEKLDLHVVKFDKNIRNYKIFISYTLTIVAFCKIFIRKGFTNL